MLSPLTFQLFGGRYQGAVSAQLGKTLSLTIKSRLQDLNVAQLAAFGGSPDTISGTLTGAGTFSGSGPDVAAVLKSARGMGTATIANGAIRRLNLVRTVVLFFGRPAADTAEGTDQFERIDTSFTLANQILRAEPLSLRSRDADIVGSVTLNVDSQALDGMADLSLSEELSKQAGTDLIRFTREGNRVVLPARLGGTIAAPRLTIDAAAATKRGLRNEVAAAAERLSRGIRPLKLDWWRSPYGSDGGQHHDLRPLFQRARRRLLVLPLLRRGGRSGAAGPTHRPHPRGRPGRRRVRGACCRTSMPTSPSSGWRG